MVSRANVPRKMTSATRLTEAEKIELEWESLWERIEASFCKIQREQEAKLDKILRSLQDLRSTMETMDASSGSCKSQLELPKFSDNLDFQKSIDVDRAIADEDLIEQHSNERDEEMDTESKVGVGDCARVSKEIEDIDFLEVEIVMPLPNIKKLGSDSHESHDKGMGMQRMELVAEEDTGIDSMPFSIPMHVLQPERKQDREGIGVVFPDYMVCHVPSPQAKKLKEVESLPIALQNASMRELAVILPILACYSLSLSWLLNWFPRPMVKLKFMVQHDEEMGGEGNAQWVSAKVVEDRIYVVILEELGWSCDGDYGAYALSNLQELTMTGVLGCDRDTQSSFVRMEELENDKYEMKLGVAKDSVDNLTVHWKTLPNLRDDSKELVELKEENEVFETCNLVDVSLYHLGKEDLNSSEREIGNSKSSSMHFDVDVKESFDVNPARLVDEEETYCANFSASLTVKIMLSSAFNSNNYLSLKWLSVLSTKPTVKMKLMVVPVDSCKVLKRGGMTRATHTHTQHDDSSKQWLDGSLKECPVAVAEVEDAIVAAVDEDTAGNNTLHWLYWVPMSTFKMKLLDILANRVFDGGGMDEPFICVLHMGIFCYMLLHTLSVAYMSSQLCNDATWHRQVLWRNSRTRSTLDFHCSLRTRNFMGRILIATNWKMQWESLAIYVEEFGNSRNIFLHFGVDARAGKRLGHGKVKRIELEQYVAAFSNYKTCSQAKKLMETECLANAGRNAQLRELATILSGVRNLKRLLVRFPKPMVKIKLVLISFCELLREADMLGVLRKKVDCQGANAWGLEQVLRVNASKALPSSAKETMAARDVLNSALDEELAPDSKVLVKGEEVGKYQDAYKLTKELLDKYGPERMLDTTTTKAGFSGIQVGAVYYSSRPVIEPMTFPFSMQAIDHLSYSAGKIKHWNLSLDSLRTRNLKGDGLLQSQIIIINAMSKLRWRGISHVDK